MPRRWRVIVASVAIVAAGLGCGALFDFDALERGRAPADGSSDEPVVVTQGKVDGEVDAGSVVDSGAEAAHASECAGTAGPTMVQIDDYCIDSTEVTQAQYRVFLDTTEGDAGAFSPAAECSWNDTFVPKTIDWPPRSELANHPVHSINWCAASAYCRWAGKYLCGGHDRATLLPTRADTANAQWFLACSRNGTRKYPYGDLFSNVCNGYETVHPLSRLPVGSLEKCEGGYSGIFDMSGNVAEWIDSCSTNGASSKTDECVVQGGDYGASAENLSCNHTSLTWRYIQSAAIGFRCCSAADHPAPLPVP